MGVGGYFYLDRARIERRFRGLEKKASGPSFTFVFLIISCTQFFSVSYYILKYKLGRYIVNER